MIDQDSVIYERVLENMDSGVMTMDPAGRIVTFNAAASSMLGYSRDEVLGRIFAEVLITRESLDEFNEAVLGAVYEGDAISVQKVVEVNLGGKQRHLALTASHLRGDGSASGENLGVIATFNDITEIRQLRESELRLAEELKGQHTKLQDAYREIEEKNEALNAVLKRAQVARIGATVFVIVLFLSIGLYQWSVDSSSGSLEFTASAEAPAPEVLGTFVVKPERIVSTVSLTGSLAPRQEVNVTSTMTGKVAAVHFQYGERVEGGRLLVELNTAEVEQEYRDAQVAYIKSQREFNRVEDWANSIEVSRARRAITKANLDMEALEDKLAETTFLLERGIIPASEHETTEQQYRNQQLDFEALNQDLEAALAQGDADALHVAKLDLDNATLRVRELEETLRSASVVAPVSGVVSKAQSGQESSSGGGETELVRGQSVSQGELLLSVGDIDGLSVEAKVDEVDIAKMAVGQQAWVGGDAFPGFELPGTISHVSSQANRSASASELPSFAVIVSIDEITAEQREKLRLGMSTNLRVIVYEKPDALLVPIDAVQTRNGKPSMYILDTKGDTPRLAPVETGVTTLDRVEIVSGVEAGDEVLLPTI